MAWLSDWPAWWAEKGAWRKYGPAAFVAAYWASLAALHGFRTDHLSMGLVILALSYGGRPLDAVLRFLLPLLGVGIVYDSQRFYSDYLRGPIHVTQPYDFDKRFFGIHTAQGILTPNEWFQLHTLPVLDVITGFMYLVFIAAYVLFSAYLFFWVSRKATPRLSAEQAHAKSGRMMWAFFWLNCLGYSTYYWYAAAPPWYVAEHGLGPADLSVQASAAGCVRFDQILGTHFFTQMYGRAADVFGAIPSLHVAYPLLATYFAFQLGAGRVFAVCFYVLMCFSAVYLNHHYILDILWGSTYAVIIAVLVDRIGEWRAKRAR